MSNNGQELHILHTLGLQKCSTKYMYKGWNHIWQEWQTHKCYMYIFWRHFSIWIQWWCAIGVWSDHIWQYQQTHQCYTSSGAIFQYKFDGDVWLVFGMTIYGKTGKYTSVIHHPELFFDMNSMVMLDWCLEWPYMERPANTQVLYIFWRHFSMWIQLVFGVTIYGKSSKYTSVIYNLEPLFNMNF